MELINELLFEDDADEQGDDSCPVYNKKDERYVNWLKNRILLALKVSGPLSLTDLRATVFVNPQTKIPKFVQVPYHNKNQFDDIKCMARSLELDNLITRVTVPGKQRPTVTGWKLAKFYTPDQPKFKFKQNRESLPEETKSWLKTTVYNILASQKKNKKLPLGSITKLVFETTVEGVLWPYELNSQDKLAVVKRALLSLLRDKKVVFDIGTGWKGEGQSKLWYVS